MIDSAHIEVRSFEFGHLDIFWSFVGAVDTFAYEWRVQRSEGPAGPWSNMTPWVQEVYYFRDNIAPLFSKARTLYYRILTRERVSQAEAAFGPSALIAEPDLVALELIRQVRMEIILGSGRIAFHLPVRSFGQRCVACWDNLSETRIKSHCLDCFDTSFPGGYLSPIQTEVDASEVARKIVQLDVDKLEMSQRPARMSNFPPVKVGDLIINDLNERFRVDTRNTLEHRGTPYEQHLVLHELPRSDIEYRIPLDLDPQTFDPLPDPRVRTYSASDDDFDVDRFRAEIGKYGGVKL